MQNGKSVLTFFSIRKESNGKTFPEAGLIIGFIAELGLCWGRCVDDWGRDGWKEWFDFGV